MGLGYNLPMEPSELVDDTGVDVNVEVMESLREELGEGFYVWENGEIVGVSGDGR